MDCKTSGRQPLIGTQSVWNGHSRTTKHGIKKWNSKALHHLALKAQSKLPSGRVQLKCDGTRWRPGREVKGKLANGVDSQYSSHYLGTCVSSNTTADAHTSAASSRLNWRPRRFKWTRPFRRKEEIWFLRVCHHISNAVYKNKIFYFCRYSVFMPFVWLSEVTKELITK